MALKEDYVDDILNSELNANRRYKMIYNDDGTVSFEDVSQYTQVGDQFAAKEVNEIAKEINILLSNGLTIADVVDNLTSTETDKPLSANQGKILKDNMDEFSVFTAATARANIVSGESLPTIFGKIAKWFSDLKTGAFNTVANNLTTTASGYVLDARQGKALKDSLDNVGDFTYDNLSTSASVANGVTKNLAKIKIPAGTYILRASAIFTGEAENSDGWCGYRRIKIGTSATDIDINATATTQVVGMPNQQTVINVAALMEVTAETTYYCNVLHTSETSIKIRGRIEAIRIC